MLPLVVIQEVRQMLNDRKLSHRKIADKLKISRGTVGAISSGRRGIFGSEPDVEGITLCCWNSPPERCRGCGATVYKPCVLCSARAYKARQGRLQLIPMPRRVA